MSEQDRLQSNKFWSTDTKPVESKTGDLAEKEKNKGSKWVSMNEESRPTDDKSESQKGTGAFERAVASAAVNSSKSPKSDASVSFKRKNKKKVKFNDNTSLTNENLLDMYRSMVLCRTLDERIWMLNRQGKAAIMASAQGHEAGQIGSGTALRKGYDQF